MGITITSTVLLFILGAAAGSFISVVIYRIHRSAKTIITGRSKCPHCEETVSVRDLIPIASYLILRGKCRNCSKEISYTYPLLELMTGLVFVLLFFKYPFLDNALIFSLENIGLYLLYGFYSLILIFTFFYDVQYLAVSDEVLLPAILIALIATFAAPLTPTFFDALFGGALAAGFFALQSLISRGKWVGLGDIRVGAFMGVILGWQLTLLALFAAYIIGSIFSLRIILKTKEWHGIKIPFAPFLVTGSFIALFWGDFLINWYLRSLGL